MKRVVFLVFIFSFFVFLPNTTVQANDNYRLETDTVSQGKVGIYFNTGTTKKIKLIVEKDGNKYIYNLRNLDRVVYFPLQMGDGLYSVKIYENTTGTKYRRLLNQQVTVKLENKDVVYLQSIQEVEWNKTKEAIQKSEVLIKTREKELGRPLTADEKTQVLYEFIIETIVYDYDKLKNLQYDYLPDIDKTLKQEKGICYDYSSLYASILRNQGVPIKLVKGYSTNTEAYHAWNEVYSEKEKRWVIVDTTTDAYLYKAKKKYKFEKSTADYTKAKEM